MAIATFEGVVENGRVRLPGDVVLPDNTKVYVVVPEAQTHGPVRVASPRLSRGEQAADFTKQVLCFRKHRSTSWAPHPGESTL